MPAARTPSPSAAPVADPVFALIEEHRAAYAEWNRLDEIAGEILAGDPRYASTLAAARELEVREVAAFVALTTARPVTLAGVLALAEYLPGIIRQVSTLPEETDAERVLRNIAVALRDFVPPAGPSGELVAMVERWQDLGLRIETASDDVEIGRLSDQHTELQIRIYRFPAASVADLCAKEPVFRDELNDGIGPLAAGADPADTLAGSAWLGLFRDFRDLERLDGSGTLPAAIEAVRPEVAVEGPVLPAMSIGELADLYDVSLQASRHLAALACTPACHGEERTLVRAFVDFEADRFSNLTMACADALQARVSTTADEQADRASILASHAARFHAWADLAGLAIAEASAGTGGRA